MEELLLLNPSRRPSKRGKSRKHRTAAQKAATRKLVAMNRAHRGGSAKKRVKSRRRSAVVSYAANPAPRKRRHAVAKIRRRHYRRNPSSSPVGVVAQLKGAAIGATGALAINTMYNMLPLPASVTTGKMAYVGRAAFALALGVVTRKMLPGGMVGKMVQGSLTVTAHDALKDIVGGMLPTFAPKLGMYVSPAYHPAAYPSMRGTPAPALSEYLNTGMSGLNEFASTGNEIY